MAGLVIGIALPFALAAASISLLPAAAMAQTAKDGRKATQPKSAEVDRNGVIILVRNALLALNHANKTGNYTVLRDLGSPGFRNNTAANLGQIFAPQREQALDYSSIAILEPQLSLLPQIEPNGMLHMAGFFPSAPLQVNFELLFEPEDGEWKIYGLSVNVSRSVPPAPDNQDQKPAKPVTSAPPPKLPSASIKTGKGAKGNP
jgi:hypothetical protein